MVRDGHDPLRHQTARHTLRGPSAMWNHRNPRLRKGETALRGHRVCGCDGGQGPQLCGCGPPLSTPLSTLLPRPLYTTLPTPLTLLLSPIRDDPDSSHCLRLHSVSTKLIPIQMSTATLYLHLDYLWLHFISSKLMLLYITYGYTSSPLS